MAGYPAWRGWILMRGTTCWTCESRAVFNASEGKRVTVELSVYAGTPVGISTSVTPTEHTQSATICQDRGSLANRQVNAVVPLPSSLGAL